MAKQCSECGKEFGFLSIKVAIDDKLFCGDCRDKRALKDEDQFNQDFVNAMISTTPSLDGYKVEEYHGTVSSFSVLKLDIIQEFMADVGDFFGGKSKGYSKKFSDLQNDVESKLKFFAVQKGGNAVIGASFNIEFVETATGEKAIMSVSDRDVIQRKLLISGSGTAVKVVKIDG